MVRLMRTKFLTFQIPFQIQTRRFESIVFFGRLSDCAARWFQEWPIFVVIA